MENISSDPTGPTNQQETKECPFCAETILARAKKCKHCGEFIDATPKQIDPNNSNMQDSEILYKEHPPMFRNKPFIFMITLALCFTGIGIVIFIIWSIRKLGTTLQLTDEKTMLRKGYFSKSTSEVFHRDVRNIQISQSAFQRLFNVGTIEISSAGQGDFEISVAGIPDPNRVKHIIDESKFINKHS